jgi:FAD binding domain/Berberine and berberine like
MTMAESSGTGEPVEGLRGRLAGGVLVAADDGYAAATQPWNLAFEQRPAVVVTAVSTRDVVESVRFAASQGLTVAVQATGHGMVRSAEGALLVCTAGMGQVSVDPASRTARVAAGLTWGSVLAATQRHGLAPLLGSAPDVGAVGYTLGGGFGWLGRKYGLSIDSVSAFEVVTADARVLRVSSTSHPELFWAMRGGGPGSLGIVTAMEIRLYPVTEVYGGNLFYPVEMGREVMRRFGEWVTDVPDELTSSVAVVNFPEVSEIHPQLRGESFVLVRGCWVGDLDAGAALIDAWREWSEPAIDRFGPMPFGEVGTISDDPVDPMPGRSSSEWLSRLDDDVIDILLDGTLPRGGPPPLVVSEVRHAGGAVRRGGEVPAAYGNRDAELLLQMIGTAPAPDATAGLLSHLAAVRKALEPHVTGGAYLNFLEGDEKRDRSPRGFAAGDLARLAAVKRAVDPADMFAHGVALGG